MLDPSFSSTFSGVQAEQPIEQQSLGHIRIWKELDTYAWTRSFPVVLALLLICGFNTFLSFNPSLAEGHEFELLWGNFAICLGLGFRHFISAFQIFYKGAERSLSGLTLIALFVFALLAQREGADFSMGVFPFLQAASVVLAFVQLFEWAEAMSIRKITTILKDSVARVGSLPSEKINELISKFFENPMPSLDRMRTWSWNLSVVALAGGLAAFWWWHREGHALNQVYGILAAGMAISNPRLLVSLIRLSALRGLSRCFAHSALVTNSDVFDRLGEITVVAFDKTGTLTIGTPVLSRILTIENISHQQVHQWAASLERDVDHPFARALVTKAQNDKLKLYETRNREIAPSKGVKGDVIVEGKEVPVVVGNLTWIYENGLEPTQVPEALRWEAEGTELSAIWVAADARIVGCFFLDDPISPNAVDTIRYFDEAGFEIGLITGDSERAAERLAKNLKLKFHHYGVLPSEKATIVKRLSEKKKKGFDFIFPKVAFVGDGRNEGPAQEAAHVGISMGAHGTDWGSAARVILLERSLPRLTELFEDVHNISSRFSQMYLLILAYHLVALAAVYYLLPQFLNASPDAAAAAIVSCLVSIMSLVWVSQSKIDVKPPA